MEKENINEQQANLEENKPKPKRLSLFKEIFSGSAITVKLVLNNLNYVLFLVLLGVIYISNVFSSEKVSREISKLQREMSNYRAESIAVSSDLMKASRQSEVYDLVKSRGLALEELKTPPFIIVDDK